MNNFFTGYLRPEDVYNMAHAKELNRQHNIGLLKGVVIGIIGMIISYLCFLS